MKTKRRCRIAGASLLLAVAALTGCSSAPRQEAQWIDPALGPGSRLLQGQKVLIACDAYDVAIRQICNDQLYREVSARGATPVVVPPGTVLLGDRELDGQLMAGAGAAGARAVLTMTLTPATARAGSGVSLGIGGFSFGGGGGAGVGLSAPIGGTQTETGFAGSARVTDAQTKRLVWATTMVAAPSSDIDVQIASLVRSALDAAKGAGLL